MTMKQQIVARLAWAQHLCSMGNVFECMRPAIRGLCRRGLMLHEDGGLWVTDAGERLLHEHGRWNGRWDGIDGAEYHEIEGNIVPK